MLCRRCTRPFYGSHKLVSESYVVYLPEVALLAATLNWKKRNTAKWMRNQYTYLSVGSKHSSTSVRGGIWWGAQMGHGNVMGNLHWERAIQLRKSYFTFRWTSKTGTCSIARNLAVWQASVWNQTTTGSILVTWTNSGDIEH